MERHFVRFLLCKSIFSVNVSSISSYCDIVSILIKNIDNVFVRIYYVKRQIYYVKSAADYYLQIIFEFEFQSSFLHSFTH